MHRKPGAGKKFLFSLIVLLIGAAAAAGVLLVLLKMDWLPPRVEERIFALLGQEREQRLLVLGDSFLSWWPIEECLNRQLKAYCGDHEIGLVNTAVGGYGPIEYRERMETVGTGFRPQLVLIFYYIGNDLTDVAYRKTEIPRSAEPKPVATAMRWFDVAFSLFETKACAQTPTLEEFDWEAMRRKGIDERLIESAQDRIRNPQAEGIRFINPYLLSVALLQPEYIVDNVLIEREQAREGWIKCQSVLRDIFHKAGEVGAKVCVVAIPQTLQVSDSHYDFYRRCTFQLDDRLLTSTRPQELLTEFCAENNVPLIDLLPVFKADGRELYWENDDHLNEAGHEVAWREVRRKVLDSWAEKQ